MDPITIIVGIVIALAVIGAISVLNFTIRSIVTPIVKKILSTAKGKEAHLLPKSVIQELIISMRERGKDGQKAAAKLSDSLAGKNARATLICDEEGNVLTLSNVEASDENANEFSDQVVKIHRDRKVEIF